ncbi:hypothetical protein [Absidia glauca]|uniref:Uncharacterized protein n=1 Tax=Absidia glauca TaxID=4829 RepID=A0A163IZ69_ABSGL|nr:hypothetical protein [Absidia glauca]
MAFAQQQIRPRHRSRPSFASTDEALQSPSPPNSNRILSPGQAHVINNSSTSTGTSTTSNSTTTSTANTTLTPSTFSDSETDWHVISSALRSSSSSSSGTTASSSSSSGSSSSSSLPPLPLHNLDRRDSLSIESSEIESYSSFRPSDTESFSDIDFAFDVLPSHDGTGAFTEDDDDFDPTTTSEEEAGNIQPQQQLSTVLSRQHHRQSDGANVLVLRTAPPLPSTLGDFEPNSPSMPNILLPYGGIHLPSFAGRSHLSTVSNHTLYHSAAEQHHFESPTFHPTAKDVTLSSDDTHSLSRQEDEYNSATTNTSSGDQINFTRKRPRNLDRIPTHHPSFPGSITSFAILSAIWNNLRRLTTHLIENDTYTADAFTTLVSEATLEGCLPFGSHLHMELAAGIRPAYNTRGYDDGLPGM